MCACTRACAKVRTVCGNQFSPSTVCFLRVHPRSSDLALSTFPRGATSPVPSEHLETASIESPLLLLRRRQGHDHPTLCFPFSPPGFVFFKSCYCCYTTVVGNLCILLTSFRAGKRSGTPCSREEALKTSCPVPCLTTTILLQRKAWGCFSDIL